MTGKQGHNLKGRQKGVKNKINSLAKDNIASVFEGIGGMKQMGEWAQENQTEFYKMYSKLIPVQVQGSGDDGDIVITINKVIHSAKDNDK